MNLWIDKLSGGNDKNMASDKESKINGGFVTGWKDIPMELLLQIVSLMDDQMMLVASGVCREWRDALCSGITHLSLSWENHSLKTTPLKLLQISAMTFRLSFKLSDPSLYALARDCHNLTKLNISGCSSFSDHALAYLARFCRKLKFLNLCGCAKAASDIALQAIGCYSNQLQSLNLGWCENVSDIGVMSLALGCPDLRTLDLCGCVLITDESVIALANGCPHLRSLGLYYCQNITDRAIYSLAHSQSKSKRAPWGSGKGKNDDGGLKTLNISQCTALTPSAVQALCDSFPALHTCSGRHSLIMSGCLSLTSVHCACAVQSHRNSSFYPRLAH